MKAAILKSLGSPLAIEDVPDPVLGTGEVIVDIAASGVVAYAGEVFSGKRKYLLDLPVIPGSGGIGRVRAIGPDATRLAIGDWVFCDPTVRSRDDARMPDLILQGVTATEGGRKLHAYFHDGSFAEQMRVPTENVTRIGAIAAEEAPVWCVIGRFLVPYGGWLKADLQAGEGVVVNGATGAFGSAAVAVALAMGASWVVATGRNANVLSDLSRRYGPRVRTVKMVGDEDADRKKILDAAPGPIDCVLDILPPAANATQVRAALLTVRPYGRVVLMGGVGMAGGPGLELPYPWLMRNCIEVHGQWMYPREATARMVAMIRAGLLPLDQHVVTAFDLKDANEAVAHAAAHAGPFEATVLQMRRGD